MSRHVSAAGTRFRLLNCGMSLLQGDVLPKTLSKHALRQRIYSCSLDFFCADKMYPVGGSVVLQIYKLVYQSLQCLTYLISSFLFIEFI
jgi:PI4-kinase N-terminal region